MKNLILLYFLVFLVFTVKANDDFEGKFKIIIKTENDSPNFVYKNFDKIIDCKVAGEIEFTASNGNNLDTINIKNKDGKDFSIYAFSKFRANVTYGIFYNPCDGEYKIYSKNEPATKKCPRIKFLVKNKIKTTKIEARMMCTEHWGADGFYPVPIQNNILSNPLVLSRSCFGAMCNAGPVYFYFYKKTKNQMESEDFFKEHISGGSFLPLHEPKESLIFEYDFNTKVVKFYLEK